jgi:serine protease
LVLWLSSIASLAIAQQDTQSRNLNGFVGDTAENEVVNVVVTMKPHDSTVYTATSAPFHYLRRKDTATSSTPYIPSSPAKPFVPQPWIKEHYAGAHYISQLTRTKRDTTVFAIAIPKYLLPSLRNDPMVESVQDNPLVYPMQVSTPFTTEFMGWGLTMVQGSTLPGSTIPPPQASSDCFKICIVDSGVLLRHPDLPWKPGMTTVWGRPFNVPYGQMWDQPIYNHGTHVAGIMAAISHNQIGIQGVLGDHTANICLAVARVFDDFGNGQLDSELLKGVEWCADQDAKVINLSFGSPSGGTEYARQVYDQIEAEGRLVFSASGNSYDSVYNYPASFESVISVGAVDATYQKADFSTFNDKVDLVAPGVAIMSTVPQPIVIVASTGQRFGMSILEYSPRISNPITSALVYCGLAKSDFDCPNVFGKICIAMVGEVSYYDKALVCQRGGGIGMIIYNDVENIQVMGRLNITSDWIQIPVVGVTKADGEAIVSAAATYGSAVTISMNYPGYAEMSGTSMATPFVSGIATQIWSIRPQCTHEQVRQALFSSALPLSTGTSVDPLYFGHGVVQAQAAYNALLQMPEPCGSAVVQPPTENTTTTTSSMNRFHSWWNP